MIIAITHYSPMLYPYILFSSVVSIPVTLTITPPVLELTPGSVDILSCTIAHVDEVTLVNFDWKQDEALIFYPSAVRELIRVNTIIIHMQSRKRG